MIFRMKVISLFLGVCLAVLAGAASAQEDPYKAKRGWAGVLYDTPVYDPHSKSYFELSNYPPSRGGSHGKPYVGAMKHAASKTFRGVRGRLAIIRSKETEEFIIQMFKPARDQEYWIGLRMYCYRHILFWVDGKRFDRSKDYANWGRNWHYQHNYPPCTGTDKFAGVILSGKETGRSHTMRWKVIDPDHYVRFGIIEYPTGRP